MTQLRINKEQTLSPGDSIERKKIHSNLGGSIRNGISTWVDGASTFLFSGIAGEESGYFDGWNGDIYEYYGQGSKGPMKMEGNNRSLLNHKELGRRLYLFKGTGGVVTYENEFYVDSENPFFNAESKDIDGNLREAIIFRLKPIKKYSPKIKNVSRIDLPKKNVIRKVPLEKSKGGRRIKQVKYVAYTTDNPKEAALVEAYNLSRIEKGLKHLDRHAIQLAGTDRILRTDGWADESKTLIEAKASAERDYIRMAIGQLFDYRKLLDKEIVIKKIAILTPEKPSDDLLELLDDLKINSIYKQDNKFIHR